MKTTTRVIGVLAIVLTLIATSGVQAGDASTLLFPFDGSYTVVPFAANGAQGSGPSAGPPLERNDDDYAQAGTGMAAVPFTFNLYGTNHTGTDIYINNNGNLSFGAGFTTFTASGFPVSGFPMVAPFWGDVDTRHTSSGVAYYKYLGANTLVVTWDNVGYYNTQADKTNTFQVAISDGTNATMGLGNNVCFSYDDMQWTTGSASGGVGGFGGTPATVGVNKGDGVDFFQIGRFDHAGNDYDGSGGNADGVSYLDGLDTCFRVDGATNQNPIWVNNPGIVTLDVTNNDVLNYLGNFIGPEGGDIVSFTSVLDPDGAQAAGLSIVTAPGNPATALMTWTPDLADLGSYNITYNFEDDFVPAGMSTGTMRIDVVPEPASALLLMAGALCLVRRRTR